MITRLAATLAIALLVLACDLRDDRVPLLTGIPPSMPANSCYTNWAVGQLMVDPTYGTDIAIDGGWTMPVMWRPGYSAYRVASEAQVLDPRGNLVATTGQHYLIEGGTTTPTRKSGVDVFWACGRVDPKP